ncbi:accessory factor UbiK family protein [Halomonas salinarum]|uniref:accessory factor UbiK family protein n=1 Tax=Halomonas salinarum TaxID=1158993 RepID=UPI00143C6B3B|nr:accessory factor UbiK family protein [Halomonas salinarum]
MVTNDRISRLAQQLGERLQGASHAPEELQRNVQQVVKGAFDRMELVTREDFDILMDVLQRTRSRVESLEKQVAALEAAIDQDAPASVETPLTAEAAEVAPDALDEPPVDEDAPSADKADKSSADKKAPGQH